MTVRLLAESSRRAHMLAADHDSLRHHAAAVTLCVPEAAHDPQLLPVGRLRRMHRARAPQKRLPYGFVHAKCGSAAATTARRAGACTCATAAAARSSPCASASATGTRSGAASSTPAAGEGILHEAAGEIIDAGERREKQAGSRGQHQQSHAHGITLG